MRTYRVYRMKETPRQQFRCAPHVSGSTTVKRKDYDEPVEFEAASEYGLWQTLRNSERPLGVGDVLENERGELVICKYVGFDPAQWWTPPPPSEAAAPESVITPVPEQQTAPGNHA